MCKMSVQKKLINHLTIYCIILTIFFNISSAPLYASDNAAQYDADDISYIALECERNQIVARQNSEKTINASLLTRMMTGLLAVEKLSLSDMIKPTSSSSSFDGKFTLSSSAQYSVDNLMKAVLLGNSDNAARTLAGAVYEDSEDFIALMNDRAVQMGMSNTFFTSVDGASDDLQRTTVYDMAIFLTRALKNSQFKNIYCSHAALIWDSTIISNPNKLLTQYSDTTYTVGGTCGYWNNNPESLQSMTYYLQTGAAEALNNITLILVTTGTDDDYEALSTAIIDDFFNNYEKSVLVEKGEIIDVLSVGTEELSLAAAATVYCIKPVDINNYVQNVSYTYFEKYSPDKIEPPVAKGAAIGTAKYLLKDGTSIEVPMVAENMLRSQSLTVNKLYTVMDENKELMIVVAILIGLEIFIAIFKIAWHIKEKKEQKR